MAKPVSLFTFSATIVIALWWWLGAPVAMPPSPLAPQQKLYCVSYAPFHGTQTPLDLSTTIPAEQIDRDLALLSQLTDCVRTYSVDFGLDRIPEYAQRHGMKVMLGLWVSSHADRTQFQIDRVVSLANRFPETIRSVIVGNEVLLRGEISPQSLADIIRGVKARVRAPVTYADVWEFWLRYRELADVVDFITIHILPYWEDAPVAADAAADHVVSIRKRVAEEFPGKEIMIGEVGWPSAGRMRGGALPSPANQARVLSDVLARAGRENFRVNVIEAFDQPWKRYLEGTVGGHWGLFADDARKPKFIWGEPVSNHPQWPWQAAGGVVLVALMFAAAVRCCRSKLSDAPSDVTTVAWAAISLAAIVAGVTAGLSVENVIRQSFDLAGLARSLALTALAVAAPVAASAALARGEGAPAFAGVLGGRQNRERDKLRAVLGWLAVALAVMALQSALALSFDPRYRDFPFAPLTAAAVPLALVGLLAPRRQGPHGLAEIVVAAMLLPCAAFIVWNETLANWQALWFGAVLALTAISLLRVRAAPS
jgi:glucan 1,3-beta-glucosidase